MRFLGCLGIVFLLTACGPRTYPNDGRIVFDLVVGGVRSQSSKVTFDGVYAPGGGIARNGEYFYRFQSRFVLNGDLTAGVAIPTWMKATVKGATFEGLCPHSVCAKAVQLCRVHLEMVGVEERKIEVHCTSEPEIVTGATAPA
jgi:hypothetical protein